MATDLTLNYANVAPLNVLSSVHAYMSNRRSPCTRDDIEIRTLMNGRELAVYKIEVNITKVKFTLLLNLVDFNTFHCCCLVMNIITLVH